MMVIDTPLEIQIGMTHGTLRMDCVLILRPSPIPLLPFT